MYSASWITIYPSRELCYIANLNYIANIKLENTNY